MSLGPAPQNYPGGQPPRGSSPGKVIAIFAGIFVAAILVIAVGIFAAIRGGAFDQAGKEMRANFDAGIAKTFFPSMHDGCVKTASARSSQIGSDKVEAYCTCVVEDVKPKLSPSDLESLSFNPKAEPGATTILQAAQSCRAKVGL